MTNSEFVKALRDAADWMEARPELGVPSSMTVLNFSNKIEMQWMGNITSDGTAHADSKEGQRAFAKLAGGRLEKNVDESYFRLEGEAGSVRYKTLGYRASVCEQVQVGTKTEPAHVIPAQPEQFVASREVPIYEWKCPPLMADEEPASEPVPVE